MQVGKRFLLSTASLMVTIPFLCRTPRLPSNTPTSALGDAPARTLRDRIISELKVVQLEKIELFPINQPLMFEIMTETVAFSADKLQVSRRINLAPS